MSKFTTNWLASLFPDYQGVVLDPIQIDDVFTDSRQFTHFGLFIPIEGERFDGHEFLKDAIKHGAIATLWSKNKPVPRFVPTDFPLFFVEDTVEAMQKLATAYREKVKPKVIGITGSNGKTTTKDFVATVLNQKFKTWKTKGNFNNHIGLPLTILQMTPDTEVLILEMGMNHFGEIETLTKIAHPDIAMITNIGESHIEYLGSRAGIAQAKSEIVEGLKEDGLLLVDGDEPLLDSVAQQYKSYRIGTNPDNDYVIKNIQITNDDTTFEVEQKRFSIPVLGEHQAKNATFCIVTAKRLGLNVEQIESGLQQVELTGMRFEKIKTKEGTFLINDAYNASATSMKASINVIKEMDAERKILVLGDILELGEHSQAIHRSVADVIQPPIDTLYTYGEESKAIIEALNEKEEGRIKTLSFSSKEVLVKHLRSELNPNTIILFKGSRGMRLEEVINQLTK
ncbi:UDP-N-acetylmuramoyl-tripeptide--D-alanyl-D-alanine ligase [Salinibacillus kushneri]|uniref:UDP-N-acetylmuramoyl-tripeptide--D-alanyl-D-alanine ligase n=1 Tax=Salinibacillus kushneri TaxID=237682 RepID=A0A1I0HN27_9BACI|nr:UDP-N-acetylmuramoyl-tripeptide--D-alanyl-D-alanine ligase [Salinibacillus kushneri]SET85460.1 UDP-N-acetylmuramoyl-tripeptide--D-alanyl-D-alanine ligase [Salinibacillus kushneri]